MKLRGDELFIRAASYVSDVFANLQLGAFWADSECLPLYLQGGYSYRLARVEGQACLLMLDHGGGQTDKAGVLKKHLDVILQHFPGPVIYVVERTTSFNRKRLVEQRIPFVVPGKQLYLPFAAVDFRDHAGATDKKPSEPSQRLSAVAQQIVLLQLDGRWNAQLSAHVIAEELGVSKMTISRAYRDITGCNLASLVAVGREKQLHFAQTGRELWKLALPYLRTPVKKKVWISLQDYEAHRDDLGAVAGETALSEMGVLMAPQFKTIAYSASDWPALKGRTQIEELPYQVGEAVAVELWRYQPLLLGGFGTVDRLSLFLSIEDKDDDRLGIAKEALLEEQWGRSR